MIFHFFANGLYHWFYRVNGAAKNNYIKSNFNLIPKESGSVQIFGMDMDTNEKAIKERIGIVLDDGGFYDELNLSEMKSIIASAYKSWDELEYKKYLDRFSLNPKQKNQYIIKRYEDEICVSSCALS